MSKKIEVAAYVWPSYTGDEPRTRMFWPEGIGEWQTVRDSKFGDNPELRQPLWGYENEADPIVMEKQIECATKYGITTFIYDWYWHDERPFLENCLNTGFLGAKNNKTMNFYLMWANHDVTNLWDRRISHHEDNIIWQARISPEEFVRMTERVIDKYFVLDNYLKIDNKPVFSIFDLENFLKGWSTLEDAVAGLDSFSERVAQRGLSGLHSQLILWGARQYDVSYGGINQQLSGWDIAKILKFDSVTHYQYVTFATMDRDYAETMPQVYEEWKKIDQNFSQPYFPHVSVGWSNQIRYSVKRTAETADNQILYNNTPLEFEKALVAAKAFLEERNWDTQIVTVNSWNEWTETSYLQPDFLNGYGYLEAIKRVFGV